MRVIRFSHIYSLISKIYLIIKFQTLPKENKIFLILILGDWDYKVFSKWEKKNQINNLMGMSTNNLPYPFYLLYSDILRNFNIKEK